uniref:NADH-ubiquinone oxidoreductase chain 4 n=1 Tax=Pennaria disticha TaxID=264068 RepID=G9ISZ9_9CNID|nr:NADH dehydrogenase subunit 4 [Pennaria disticha]
MIIILIIIPFISILNLILINRNNIKKLYFSSLFWSIFQILIYSIFYINDFNNFTLFQYNLNFNWLINNNSQINWGNLLFMIDGISLIFIGLSIILIPICIIISFKIIKFFIKEFLICLFFTLILLITVFSIMDILGFYILFEIILIPMFFIIGIWGSRLEKIKAAYYFFFYTLCGSLLLLISIFKLYSLIGSTNYFNLIILVLPENLQYWLFIGFFFSLAIKIPMFPFHIWLPQAHVEAPIAGSILLAGILLKLGGYGFIRFSYPIIPLASNYFNPIIITLSCIAIIYGGLTTFRQNDIKRLIAYSSVSHMGLVTLSIFTHSIEGIIASIIMMVAHGVVSSGLFMTTSILYSRLHTRLIKYYKGLTSIMPIFSTIMIILILGNISFPLTINFIAEFLSLLSITNYNFFTGIIVGIGIFIGTLYSLFIFNKMFFGQLNNFTIKLRDLLYFEYQSFLPIIFFTIFLGIYPNILIKWTLLSSLVNISL